MKVEIEISDRKAREWNYFLESFVKEFIKKNKHFAEHLEKTN